MTLLKTTMVLSLLSGICPHLHAQPPGALPHTIIYKTTIDYSQYVPVELTANKKKIASYPAPTDMSAAMKPVALHERYWLSKTGVSKNTAFLGIKIDDYIKLKHSTPSVRELYYVIKDKSPMTEIWDCGTDRNITPSQLNEWIDKMQLQKKCKKIK